ncbi:hypothetical protein [Streptomyces sp. CAU 1734]|uniref:hypothetical protein n=1 Tax=Streptomyces sp. CAU 1734 TaxID=3140360 RepID=UPI00326050F6
MTRIQILELPQGDNDDRPPFVLVVDDYTPTRHVTAAGQHLRLRDDLNAVARQIGAAGVLTFAEMVEIPANEVPVGPDGYPVRLAVEWDLGDLGSQVEAQTREARARERTADRVREELHFQGHQFGGPGFTDPMRCSVCHVDQTRWMRLASTYSPCPGVPQDYVYDEAEDHPLMVQAVRDRLFNGHRFGEPGFSDPARCSRCHTARRTPELPHTYAMPCPGVPQDQEEDQAAMAQAFSDRLFNGHSFSGTPLRCSRCQTDKSDAERSSGTYFLCPAAPQAILDHVFKAHSFGGPGFRDPIRCSRCHTARRTPELLHTYAPCPGVPPVTG